MPKRLLDRQSELIAYLTSAPAIFGDGGAPIAASLRRFDRRLLAMEARFSFEKRMDKVAAVFPRTLALLGERRHALFRDFAAACPPKDISRLENARQFYMFLSRRRPRQSPPYLLDAAACELAFASVRSAATDAQPRAVRGAKSGSKKTPDDARPRAGAAVRRARGAALLRQRYDVRSLFESVSAKARPVKRNTFLAVAAPTSGADPAISLLPRPVFELLEGLERWTNLAAFEAGDGGSKLITELVERGLVELRR
jgi:hypothetical protein